MSDTPSVTFAEFARTWLAKWAAVRLKASAYREYESVVRLHLVPALGASRLPELVPEVVQAYVSETLAAGLAPASVRNHVIVLKRILSVAVDYGLLAENPVDKVAMPRIERSEMAFLTPGEIRRLIDATSPAWALLLALPAMVGLRAGECRALEWSDIDPDRMTVSVTKSMRGNGIVTSPKTRSSVSRLPLPETLSPYIAQRRRQAGGHRLVFCKVDGSPLSSSTPGRILARSLRAAGLPQVRFHDLRHAWACAHIRAGTDLKTLAMLGRWSSVTSLVETYAHILDPVGAASVRNLDRLLGEEE